MSKDDPNNKNAGGELVTEQVHEELENDNQDRPTTSVAAGVNKKKEADESSLEPISEPSLEGDSFESDESLELDPDDPEYTISEAKRRELEAADEEERQQADQSNVSPLPYKIHIAAGKSEEQNAEKDDAVKYGQAINDDDSGQDDSPIKQAVDDLKNDGSLKQAVLFNALQNIMQDRQQGASKVSYSFNRKSDKPIHQDELLSNELSTRKLEAVINNSNGYSLYSNADSSESVYDLEFTQEGGASEKLPDATECVGMDLTVKNDVIDSLDKDNHHPSYESVKANIHATVNEMLDKGMDVFDIQGNDKLSQIFADSLQEAAKLRGVNILVKQHGNLEAEQTESTSNQQHNTLELDDVDMANSELAEASEHERMNPTRGI